MDPGQDPQTFYVRIRILKRLICDLWPYLQPEGGEDPLGSLVSQEAAETERRRPSDLPLHTPIGRPLPCQRTNRNRALHGMFSIFIHSLFFIKDILLAHEFFVVFLQCCGSGSGI
jgi:hypothetical protein